jgi:hypothetical protein
MLLSADSCCRTVESQTSGPSVLSANSMVAVPKGGSAPSCLMMALVTEGGGAASEWRSAVVVTSCNSQVPKVQVSLEGF